MAILVCLSVPFFVQAATVRELLWTLNQIWQLWVLRFFLNKFLWSPDFSSCVQLQNIQSLGKMLQNDKIVWFGQGKPVMSSIIFATFWNFKREKQFQPLYLRLEDISLLPYNQTLYMVLNLLELIQGISAVVKGTSRGINLYRRAFVWGETEAPRVIPCTEHANSAKKAPTWAGSWTNLHMSAFT